MDNLYIIQTEYKKFFVYTYDDNESVDTEDIMKFVNEVTTWCKEACGNDYETWNFKANGCVFAFEKDEDAMAFKLRWT